MGNNILNKKCYLQPTKHWPRHATASSSQGRT